MLVQKKLWNYPPWMLTTRNPLSDLFTIPWVFPNAPNVQSSQQHQLPQEPAAGTTVGLLALRTPLKAMTNFPSSHGSGDVKLSRTDA